MPRNAIYYLVSLMAIGGPTPADYAAVDQSFSTIMDATRSNLLTRNELRQTWQQLGEAFGDDTMQGHGIRKPFGYAGDFEMIDRIYVSSITENKHLRRWDEYFQSREACIAVRNRKSYFINLVNDIVSRNESVRILNVGSGPARDVLEFFAQNQAKTTVAIDCIDMDKNAINYSTELCAELLDHVSFHRANIFKWRTENTYDLVWSAGLFDYLNDQAFVILFRRLAAQLNPHGALVVGNFSPNNPTRDYMEFGEWNLHHRSKNELTGLAKSCRIPNSSLGVGEEPQGINLFLKLIKNT